MAILLASAMALVSLATGFAHVGEIETGAYSEQVTLTEAKAMVADNHRAGIVEYTHFPNGPLYVAAALVALGVEPARMRSVPIVVAALCVGMLTFAVSRHATSLLLQAWSVLAIGLILLQPAFAQWQGALHEHSYAASLAFLGLAASLLLTRRTSWLLAPFGFLLGWVGYDWIPGQAILVLAGRWLFYARSRELTDAALLAAYDGLKFGSGFCLAVLAHLGQLGLYFGSMEAAVRDLFGSAAARAALSSQDWVDPEYLEYMRNVAARLETGFARSGLSHRFGPEFSALDPPRWRTARLVLELFLTSRWTHAAQLACLVAGGAAVVCLKARRRSTDIRPAPASATWIVGGVALCLAIASGFSWSLLMRAHAIDHLHILPRHWLMGLALWVAIPVLLFAQRDAQGAESWTPREVLPAAAAYALAPLVTVMVGVYAVFGLG